MLRIEFGENAVKHRQMLYPRKIEFVVRVPRQQPRMRAVFGHLVQHPEKLVGGSLDILLGVRPAENAVAQIVRDADAVRPEIVHLGFRRPTVGHNEVESALGVFYDV